MTAIETDIGKKVAAIATKEKLGFEDKLILNQAAQRLDCWWEYIQELIAELGKQADLEARIKELEEECKGRRAINNAILKNRELAEAENKRLKKEKKFLMKLSHRSDEDLNKMLKDKI